MATTQLQSNNTSPDDLVEKVDFFRFDISRKIDSFQRADLGQFLTPPSVAQLMALMFTTRKRQVRLLDAGARVESLSAAWIAAICSRTEVKGTGLFLRIRAGR